jgi:HEAT repeat protein
MATNPEFSQVLDQLRDTSQPYPPTSLYQLSDLSREDVAALEGIWQELPEERRASIIQKLHDIGDDDFEVTFDAVHMMALDDESPLVRAAAIRGLWESEDESLIGRMVNFLLADPDHLVRAAAASALGRFVYLAEIEELPETIGRRLGDTLLDVVRGDDHLEVRRRALESAGYSGRPEVAPLIASAYEAPETPWRVSAVFAMGRSAQSERWAKPVLTELESPDPEMRFEAARAAGELELQDAVPLLIDLVSDADPQVHSSAIWSLSQIGGNRARRALERKLERTVDDDERAYLEEALDNLEFTDELHAFTLMEFGDEEAGFSLDGGSGDEDDDELVGDDEVLDEDQL